jgi:hypothetical protein
VLSALLGLLAATALAVPSLPAGTDVDYQLGGATEPAANVGIVVRDRTEPPAPGRFNICYVNGFQTQPDADRFWQRHRRLLLHDASGAPVVDEDWGETLLDVRTAAKRRALARIEGRWLRGCTRHGFVAAELDNLDSFTRSHGLISRSQAMRFAALLVRAAHRNGLAVGQKNLAGFDGTRIGYDFAVAEECGRYDECGRYVADFGDQVLMIEYHARDFAETCTAFGADHSVELRDRDLTPSGVHGWC